MKLVICAVLTAVILSGCVGGTIYMEPNKARKAQEHQACLKKGGTVEECHKILYPD